MLGQGLSSFLFFSVFETSVNVSVGHDKVTLLSPSDTVSIYAMGTNGRPVDCQCKRKCIWLGKAIISVVCNCVPLCAGTG